MIFPALSPADHPEILGSYQEGVQVLYGTAETYTYEVPGGVTVLGNRTDASFKLRISINVSALSTDKEITFLGNFTVYSEDYKYIKTFAYKYILLCN